MYLLTKLPASTCHRTDCCHKLFERGNHITCQHFVVCLFHTSAGSIWSGYKRMAVLLFIVIYSYHIGTILWMMSAVGLVFCVSTGNFVACQHWDQDIFTLDSLYFHGYQCFIQLTFHIFLIYSQRIPLLIPRGLLYLISCFHLCWKNTLSATAVPTAMPMKAWTWATYVFGVHVFLVRSLDY